MAAEIQRSRFQLVLPVLGLLLAALGGCSRGQDPNELQFWTIQLSPKFDPLMRSMLKEWEQRVLPPALLSLRCAEAIARREDAAISELEDEYRQRRASADGQAKEDT